MTPTQWPARRVGDRLLCGRPTKVSGGCRGLIATIGRFDDAPIDEATGLDVGLGSETGPTLEAGMVEAPRGSNIWRVSERAKALRARSQKVELPNRMDPAAGRGRRSWRTTPALPFWRACPVCKVLAEVNADLL